MFTPVVGGRKKILEGHATLPRKISEIEIICVVCNYFEIDFL